MVPPGAEMDTMIHTFDQLGLSPELLQGLIKLGFKKPTDIQSAVIPELLGGDRDLVAKAQTGTGKTAAFGLPILHRLKAEIRLPQALILCPTRELCMQIARDLTQLADSMKDIRILPVYGGADIRPQLTALRRGVQIVVATPGRMVDMLRRKAVDLSVIRCVVLDEADEMLSMGFEEDLQTIMTSVPEASQTMLFSATMPRTVADITRNYMQDPATIAIGMHNTGPDNVVHEYYVVHARDRYLALKRIVDLIPNLYGIVFCRTRQETQEIADWLGRDGYPAHALHGDLSQQQRDRVMKAFRNRHCPLLVATDVAARGLDVRNLTHIINYSLPDDPGAYTHRSGRTGRAGESGVSIVLINLREHSKLHRIEKQIGRKFISRTVPSGDDICRVRLHDWIKRWQNLEPESALLDELMPALIERLDGMSRDELLRKVAYQEVQRLLEYYRDQPDLNPEVRREPHADKSNGSNTAHGNIELVLNVGAVNGLTPTLLLRMIETVARKQAVPVGRIKIAKMQTYMEIPASLATYIVKSFNTHPPEIAGRKVNVAVAGARRQLFRNARSKVGGDTGRTGRTRPPKRKLFRHSGSRSS